MNRRIVFQLVVMVVLTFLLLRWMPPAPKELTWEQIWQEQLSKPRPNGY